MTPATQAEVYMRRDWRMIRPRDPQVIDDVITWDPDDEHPVPAPNLDELLPDYCALASATGPDAVRFVRRWGVPEIGWWDTEGRAAQWDADTIDDWPTQLPIGRLREHALAVAAARRLGAALTSRHLGDPADWKAANAFLNPYKRRSQWLNQRMADELGKGWQLEREHFGALISDSMRESGVATVANWVDHDRLTLTPACKGLVGVIALLVAREVGSGHEFTCSSCGAPVVRRRAPLDGERVYCDSATCKREQQRRNQAAYRARKREAERSR